MWVVEINSFGDFIILANTLSGKWMQTAPRFCADLLNKLQQRKQKLHPKDLERTCMFIYQMWFYGNSLTVFLLLLMSLQIQDPNFGGYRNYSVKVTDVARFHRFFVGYHSSTTKPIRLSTSSMKKQGHIHRQTYQIYLSIKTYADTWNRFFPLNNYINMQI